MPRFKSLVNGESKSRPRAGMLMGHADVRIMEISTPGPQRKLAAVTSPLDTLDNADPESI